ncbi:P-type ATPase 2 [Theileria orientalis]|uniref:Phospholipid-transporting ATPase n=1 Tax=Theileria orientalis TaxID=68886 RepID=A0A976QWY1_THEOR|nr:P-type ATPase 2 [Theileria orientalis]
MLFLDKLYEYIYNKYFKKPDELERSFYLNRKLHFPCSNRVKTTKYTPYNFVFKNLYEQLSIPSNFYFVIIAILQSTPQVSSTHGYPVVLLPFIIVLLFSAFKDAYEDYQRYLSDNQLNNNLLQIVNLPCVTEEVKPIQGLDVDQMDRYDFVKGAIKDNVLKNKYWKDLKVGELVFLQNKDIAPADMVLLATSEENGYAFVDSSSLDGETNIKKKESIFEVYNHLGSDFDTVVTEVQKFLGFFNCEGPNKNLMSFDGSLKYYFSENITPIRLSNELMTLISSFKSRVMSQSFGDGPNSSLKPSYSLQENLMRGEHRSLTHSNTYIGAGSPREGPSRQISLGSKRTSSPKTEDPTRLERTESLKALEISRKSSIGHFEVNLDSTSPVQVSLTNLLLRGCKLMNTQWVVGFVVFTGHDTKIYRNISKAPNKISNLQRKMMMTTFLICMIQLGLCLCATIYNMYLHGISYYERYTYLSFRTGKSMTEVFFITFFSWIALTANFVPISAIVTLNMVKLIQGFFIQLDNSMYCEELNMNAKARNTMLNEELGQVKYLFSDKTGTLTCNKMEFRKFCLLGHSYGQGYTDVIRFVYAKKGIYLEKDEENPNYSRDSHVNLVDDTLFMELRDTAHPRHDHLVDFFMHLAVNNWAVPDSADVNTYICSSPDELCFVNAAAFCGFKLIMRSSNFVILKVFDQVYKVKIVAQADFDYKRKCSTTIVAYYKDLSTNFVNTSAENGSLSSSRSLLAPRDFNKMVRSKDRRSKIVSDELEHEDLSKYRFVLYCKGGDNVMLKKMKNLSDLDNMTVENMKNYSMGGLRTLMFGKRELDQEEFRKWLSEYNTLKVTLEGREEKLAQCVAKLECDLELQGVTGIEDKLQAGVAECIESMLTAGINVWMLTGDNLDTSINIGIATNLINMLSDRIMLDSTSVRTDDIKKFMEDNIERIEREKDVSRHRCLVVDSINMEEILKDENSPLFLKLVNRVHSVLCCRMTPYLKGAVVSLVKTKLKKITLAIGDGGNDCNMIQIAHVGVGIKGKEGSQAFNASDFGIGQFRFLAPLMLHHGRCCYRRSAKCVNYMFYKNVILVIPLFYYGFLSFFSGQKIYFSLFVAIYNVVFTCLPVMIVGIIDQDYTKDLSSKYPHVYQLGQKNYYYNVINFSCWILNSVVQSAVIFAMMTLGFSDSISLPFRGGIIADAPTMGIVLLSMVFIVVTLKLILETWYFTRITTLSHVVSIFFFMITVIAFSSCPPFTGNAAGSAFTLLTSYRFWVVLLGTVMLALYRDYFYKVFLYSFAPHYYHHIQRVEYLKLDELRGFD